MLKVWSFPTEEGEDRHVKTAFASAFACVHACGGLGKEGIPRSVPQVVGVPYK